MPCDTGPSICPRCASTIAIGVTFCPRCGTRLVFFCWSCGAENALDASFCERCGTDHRDSAPWRVDDAAGSDRARPDETVSTPPPPRGGIEQPGPASSEERRRVTVLFADLVGYTPLAERLDPEDVREIMATIHGKLVQEITLFGGTIDKFIGDAVMALFGTPVAHEDDPVRAVHAALAMQRAIGTTAETERDGEPIRPRLRVGINTGEVVTGLRDIGGYEDRSVYGDVVNTAARLQMAAEPGSILLGETTARLVQHAFAVEPTSPLDLKGKELPVQAYRVLQSGRRPMPETLGGGPDDRVPLVGRLDELRRLRRALHDLARGRGQIVSIIGDHGIGKSRLVWDVRRLADELGLRWVEASAPSYAQAIRYRMFRATLGELFGIAEGDPEPEAAGRLMAGLRDLDAEAAYPHLAFVLGLPNDPATIEELRALSAEQLQRRAFTAVRQLLRSLAHRQPLILVLDDLEWADPSSVALLDDMMELTDEVPILLCFLFTPEQDAPAWDLKEHAARAYPHRYVEIRLRPLSDRSAHELMCSLLQSADLPPHLEEMILAKAEGNPYFVEEVVRGLVDSDVLRRVDGRWVADRDVRAIDVPDTLLALVAARLDRLPEPVRRTLQVAAVIGREFSERVLRHVIGESAETDLDLDRHLREAQRAGLIREDATIPERRFSFTQALVQEAALRSLLVRRRRELHVQVGWALEALMADNLDEQYGSLAHHYYEGEAWERAFEYGRLAGNQAAAAVANEEAVANYTIAIESAERSAAGADPDVLADLVERRADVRELVGDYALAARDYQRAHNHYQATVTAADPTSASVARERLGRIALKLARTHAYRDDIPALEDALKEAFASLPPESPELAVAWSLKAIALIWKMEIDDAANAARTALEIARRDGSYRLLEAGYQALTYPALIGVLGPTGHDLAHEWVALARQQEVPPALFRALVAHVFIHVWGLWSFHDSQLAETSEALDLARRVGSPAMEATVRGLLGAGQVLAGRWLEAEQELRRVVGQPTSLSTAEAISVFWLGRVLTLRGALEEGRVLLESRLDADPANRHTQIAGYAQLALNRHAAADAAAARLAMERANAALRELGCTLCATVLHAFAAEMYADLDDVEQARGHAERARRLGTDFGRKPTVLAGLRAESAICLNAGEIDRALELLGEAWALAREIDQPYETARTAELLGRAYTARGARDDAQPAREYLQLALSRFTALGAQPDVQRVTAARQALVLAD